MEFIDRFEGAYRFLSNFYEHKLTYNGETWRTAEHAFQASKVHPGRGTRQSYLLIKQAATPGMAKRLGRNVVLRADWEEVKIRIMRDILRAKFSDPKLRDRLLATGQVQLIEGNHWYDTFWGVCNGRGQNWLGELLMEVRSELQSQVRHEYP